MEPDVRPKTYTSPQRKLVKFFEQSRNQWKAKCREAKVLVKRLQNRTRFLERSRDQWKKKATSLQAELRLMSEAYTPSQQDVDRLKKTVGQHV